MKRIAVAALVAALLPAVPAAAAFPGRNGALVYGWSGTMPDPGGTKFERVVQSVAPNGGSTQTLAGCSEIVPNRAVGRCATAGYYDPAFSPDGSEIAFDIGQQLAVMDASGRNLRMLPKHSLFDGEPSFSPTGSQLAFSAAGHTLASARDVWISDVSGAHAASSCQPASIPPGRPAVGSHPRAAAKSSAFERMAPDCIS